MGRPAHLGGLKARGMGVFGESFPLGMVGGFDIEVNPLVIHTGINWVHRATPHLGGLEARHVIARAGGPGGVPPPRKNPKPCKGDTMLHGGSRREYGGVVNWVETVE